jgi:hypothetical protein
MENKSMKKSWDIVICNSGNRELIKKPHRYQVLENISKSNPAS